MLQQWFIWVLGSKDIRCRFHGLYSHSKAIRMDQVTEAWILGWRTTTRMEPTMIIDAGIMLKLLLPTCGMQATHFFLRHWCSLNLLERVKDRVNGTTERYQERSEVGVQSLSLYFSFAVRKFAYLNFQAVHLDWMNDSLRSLLNLRVTRSEERGGLKAGSLRLQLSFLVNKQTFTRDLQLQPETAKLYLVS
jgi:hypothetical protein